MKTVGFLQRWNLESNGGWRDTGGIGGLSTVKSMALIHRDTSSVYLYSFSNANGRATVIKNLGKVPGTFNDPHYFRWAPKSTPSTATDTDA